MHKSLNKMNGEMRKSGIEIVGDIPWGTHICQFYQDKNDLIEILVPYFKEGLRDNEFCMWITCEPLSVDEVKKAMRKSLPGFDRYLKKAQIEILPYNKWYLKGGSFNSERVLKGWVDKLNLALSKGYAGLRLTGNTFWLEKKDWRQFTDYEEAINNTIGKYRMVAICTYSLDKCGALELIDVVRNHQFALIRRANKWEVIESSERKKAEKEIARLATFPELNPNPVLEVDYSGKIYYLNPAAKRLFFTLKDYDIRHKFLSDLPSVLNVFKSQKKNLFFRDICIGNTWFQQQLSYVPQFKRIRIYNVNITAQKKITEALKKAKAELELKVAHRTSQLTEINKQLIEEILERSQMEREIRIRNSISKLIARVSSRKEYLDVLVKLISGLTGCRCVGIRVPDERRRVPYESYLGFNREFWESENSLSVDRDNCACIRVFSGKSQPQDLKVMSEFGTFCCGNIMKFIKELSGRETTEFRGACAESGFTTIAIVPVRYKNETIALIHLADERENWLGQRTLKLIESVSVLIGEGINKFTLLDKVRENNEILEKLYSSAHFSIVYLDNKFNFIRVNKAYADVEGLTSDFFAGKNHFDLYPHEENRKIFQRVVDTGQPHTEYAKPFIYPKHPEWGATYWDWSLYPVKDPAGKVEGLVFFLVDVTKRKLAENELMKTQSELNERKRLSDIGTLAATIAHELRNPLAAINMAAYNIKRKAQNPLLERHLLTIEKKVSESDQIINNLLFYSRIKIPHYENIDICEIIDECAGVARERCRKAKASVYRKLKLLKGVTVEADPLQIKEVFSNILNNAYDAILNHRGKIELSGERDNRFVRVRIADNGPGIDGNILNKVFDPFFTTKAKGTGLGLTVCRQILSLHGGAIDIKSQIGKGTTVTVELPINRQYNGKENPDNR